jgi:hypothetical protein
MTELDQLRADRYVLSLLVNHLRQRGNGRTHLLRPDVEAHVEKLEPTWSQDQRAQMLKTFDEHFPPGENLLAGVRPVMGR